MPLNIRSEEVNQLAETLAARKRINKTDAVKQALENEIRRLDQALPAPGAAALLCRIGSWPRPATGLEGGQSLLR